MEIKFVKREDIVNTILEKINNNQKISDEEKQLLIDLSK